MPVLGLTGSLASGKSTVLRLLAKKGARTFDADKRVHYYYKQNGGAVYRKIAKTFPRAIEKGRLCREKLARIVFSNKSALSKLESIIHPVVIKDMGQWKLAAGDKRKIYVAEVPLLFEKRLKSYFDAVILVNVARKVLIRRIMKKYGLSKAVALKRLSLYMPVREKIKKADFVIDNSVSLKRLKKEVDLLWKKVKQSLKVKK